MTETQWPQWTTELTARFVTGEDQLGVEGAAQSYQQYLVPGIITTTDHARYYSFYAWVLYRFINWPESSRLMKDFRGPFFRRHEAALIAAAYSHHKEGDPLGGLVGSGVNAYKARDMWEKSEPVDLDFDYFQNTLGGFGQYYGTAMRAMGIIADPEHPRWVYRLTTQGEQLAQAYERSIDSTTYLKALNHSGSLAYLSYADAAEYGSKGCICPQALEPGPDRPLLRDAFFRFEQQNAGNPHVRRRNTLGVALDLVRQANSAFQREMARPALYLGEYEAGRPYRPAERLHAWAAKWGMVEIRHLYTFGLQCLWAAFLIHLSQQENGVSLGEYLKWLRTQLDDGIYDLGANDYLDARCRAVSLSGSWKENYAAFAQACLQATEQDEYSLYLQAINNRYDSSALLKTGLQILAQLFLRFLPRHEHNDPTWMELATRERLPMTGFFDALRDRLCDSDWTVGDWLEWVYRELVLGQHEFIALEKLRYQEYDTFKFYYRDGRFYWPFATPDAYREPIRLAALRLFNVLTILTDLGLITENDQGRLHLSPDGTDYLDRILEESNRGD